MTYRLLCSVMFQLTLISLMGQASISGKLVDPSNQPLSFATVALFGTDSSLVMAELSDANGNFSLSPVGLGSYYIEVTSLGFEKNRIEPVQVKVEGKLQLEPVVMAPSSLNLNEAVVEGQRMLIEVHPDKTVFNVDGSINATGNTALELLRKSPGVVVDNNDNIMLSSKSGVVVYIDGKPTRLSSEDLAARLQAMQSSEIDAIEIITNPGARYEAEGNAGIINIRLKKDKSLGANANMNLGYAIGRYSKYNASSNFNYRNRSLNLYGAYAYNGGKRENWMNIYRIQNSTTFDQQTVSFHTPEVHTFRLGSDFFLSKKSTLGLMVSGYYNEGFRKSDSYTVLADETSGIPFSILDATSEDDVMRKNGNVNLNYRFDDAKGLILNIDADAGRFKNTSDSYQPNYYLTPNEDSIIQANIYTSEAPTQIDIYAFKIDHERPLWNGQMGAGIKVSKVITDNTYNFYNETGGQSVLDIDRSNNFVFNENINAAYLSYNRQIKKYGITLGVRGEQTNSEGILTAQKNTENDSVKRSYLDIFPSAGISYQATPSHQLRVNNSRRIDRPSYHDLNPFEYKFNELSFARGNPFLQPQYTHSLSIAHTYKYRLNTEIKYSYTQDYFAKFSDSAEGNTAYLEAINLDYQQVLSLTVSLPFSPRKWWNTYTNLTASHLANYADLEDGRTIDLKANSIQIYHQSTFLLPKDFSLEISGWAGSPSVWGAVFKTDANWSIDAGIKKKLWDDRASLKIAVSDIFNTAPWRGVQDLPGYYADARGGWESRQLRINFSYLFGKNTVKKARDRKTGLEEEKDRVE